MSWDERAPPATTQPVIEFLAMQMYIHHPQGARTLAEGAMWAGDQAEWRHQLVRMLQNMVETTIGNRLRQNKTRAAKTAAAYELPDMLVRLAADIYRQTLAMASGEQEGASAAAQLCDVTQIVPELEATAAGPTQKRPRLERGDERRRGLDLSWRGFMERTVYGTDTDLGKIPQVSLVGFVHRILIYSGRECPTSRGWVYALYPTACPRSGDCYGSRSRTCTLYTGVLTY
jgi:hypothetical protein